MGKLEKYRSAIVTLLFLFYITLLLLICSIFNSSIVLAFSLGVTFCALLLQYLTWLED